jgi:hypothetical protein
MVATVHPYRSLRRNRSARHPGNDSVVRVGAGVPSEQGPQPSCRVFNLLGMPLPRGGLPRRGFRANGVGGRARTPAVRNRRSLMEIADGRPPVCVRAICGSRWTDGTGTAGQLTVMPAAQPDRGAVRLKQSAYARSPSRRCRRSVRCPHRSPDNRGGHRTRYCAAGRSATTPTLLPHRRDRRATR